MFVLACVGIEYSSIFEKLPFVLSCADVQERSYKLELLLPI